MSNLVNNKYVKANVFRSLGTSSSANIKNSGGKVFSFSCTNLGTSIRYFQLFNSTTAPSNGNTPLMTYPVYPEGGLLIIDSNYLGEIGTLLNIGISFGFSSTPLTFTEGTASNCIVEVLYV